MYVCMYVVGLLDYEKIVITIILVNIVSRLFTTIISEPYNTDLFFMQI